MLLVGGAALAQTGQGVTDATKRVNDARQGTVRGTNVTSGGTYRATGIDTVGEKTGVVVDQRSETKLSFDEKRVLANALVADIRSAMNSLTGSIGKAEGQGDEALATCLRRIQERVRSAEERATPMIAQLSVPGTYSQIRA